MSAPRPFTVTPRGPFSLAEANAFGFGQREAEAAESMILAFATDGGHEPAGVVLRQAEPHGPVEGELYGDAPLEAAVAQTARVLSLDHDGTGWQAVVDREAPLGRIAAELPGLRPVLFHSPYEAACWSVISARKQRAQAARTRDALAADLGTTFTLDGRPKSAFPRPEALLTELTVRPGLTGAHVERLQGIARAAADGDLEATELQRIGPEAATERVLGLKGIGPFYASLIVLRATGFTDLPVHEPRARAAALRGYGLPETTGEPGWAELSDRWRPFRIWATVSFRVAAARGVV